MEPRLSQVLRAGEARRQPARTGALQMAELDDDALRLITDAIGNGDTDAACRAAKNWCALNKRHRTMCQEGGSGLWDALTTRVFGANQIGAHRQDSQANFFELCRIAVNREAARRWFRARHPRWTMTGDLQSDAFLDRLGAILVKLDNYVGRPAQKVILVAMLQDLFVNKPDGFPNTDLLALYSLDSLYAMVRGDNYQEIDAALRLLGLLASDIDYDGPSNRDLRVGYVPAMVPMLLRLLMRTSDSSRKLLILDIWNGLLSYDADFEGDDGTVDEMSRYARALLRANATQAITLLNVTTDNATIRRRTALLMENIAYALNESLNSAMYDAARRDRGFNPTMNLVHGHD